MLNNVLDIKKNIKKKSQIHRSEKLDWPIVKENTYISAKSMPEVCFLPLILLEVRIRVVGKGGVGG